jgi:hypothetical protein
MSSWYLLNASGSSMLQRSALTAQPTPDCSAACTAC